MSVRKRRGNKWYYRTWVRKPSGLRVRVFGVPSEYGLPNTETGAKEAMRRKVNAILDGQPVRVPVEAPTERVPTVLDFAPTFLELSRAKNKASSADSKATNLDVHILPAIGTLRLDEVTYAIVEDLKVALLKKPIANVSRRKDGKQVALASRTLSAKTVNNILGTLHRLLMVAKKRGAIAAVPEFEWLKVPDAETDFLTFDECDALLAGCDPEWRAMITVAARTGLRLGELMALRWEDVDLRNGRIVVRRNVVKGKFGTPKGGKSRTVDLGDDAIGALKSHRHLRGELVFSDDAGKLLRLPVVRYGLERSCRISKSRYIGWHVLRHTFASHLVMRGVSLSAVQKLLGHTTITMTMRYAHLSPDVTRDAVRLIDRGARLVPTRGEKTGQGKQHA